MSTFLAFVIISTFVAGAIAVPGQVDSWQSQGTTVRELEKRLENLESMCVNQAIKTKEEGSKLDIDQRFIELEKRLDETKVIVDETNLGLSNIQRDVFKLKSATRTRQHDVSETLVASRTADLWQTVSGYVNKSLAQLGVEQFGQRCQSGIKGITWYKGIEYTWPRTYMITFDPPFRHTPQFTYGIVHLDSSFVRVDISVKALSRVLATVEIATWEAKDLFGVKFRWMACL